MTQEDKISLEYLDTSDFIPRTVEEAEAFFLQSATDDERSTHEGTL